MTNHPQSSVSNRSPYAQRRARLAAQLGPDGIAILPTARERPRNRDTDYPFRHDSYFYYLTGFDEPNAWLVLTGDGSATLFCQPKDLEREIWDGYRLGPEAALGTLGVDAAHPVGELDQRLPRLLENRDTVWFPFATHKGLETRIDSWLQSVRARVRFGALCPESQRDLCVPLDEMRLVKDAHELSIMRRAAAISADAHVRAIRLSARMLREGREPREYQLDAELLYAFRMSGSQYPAYPSIVAAGVNACVLHYRAGDARLEKGKLVLIDAGCELDGYASDITRTFPADGTFRGSQRALYEIVAAAQAAAVAAIRPGARFNDPHEAAVRVLAQGMLDVGLLDADRVGSIDDVIEQRAYFPFYMHRTGHWLGMDVHDCGSYVEPSQLGEVSERTDPLSGELIKNRPSRILKPGMVLTVEPGLYVRPGEGVPERFHGIGIRIEDDAVVSDAAEFDGCELISRGVPVDADEIEALMRG